MRGRILGVAPERESYVRAGHYHQDAGQLGERTVPKAAEENLRKTFFFYFFFPFLQFRLKIGGRHSVQSLVSCPERWLSFTLAARPALAPRLLPRSLTAACTRTPRERAKSKDRQKETQVTAVGSGCPRGGGWWELSGGEPAGIFGGDGMFSVLPRMVHTGVYV